MMSIKVEGDPQGKMGFDMKKVGDILAALVPGAIRKRVSEGKDIHGNPFAGYSAGYMQTLSEMGESSNVDMRLTGGLMNSVKLLRRDSGNGAVELIFGPDAGSSPTVTTPSRGASQKAGGGESGRLAAAKKRASVNRRAQRETEQFGVAQNRGRMVRTGGYGPAHNLVGLWIHRGGPGRPPRPWCALSPEQQKEMIRAILSKGILTFGGRKTVAG